VKSGVFTRIIKVEKGLGGFPQGMAKEAEYFGKRKIDGCNKVLNLHPCNYRSIKNALIDIIRAFFCKLIVEPEGFVLPLYHADIQYFTMA